MFAKDDDDSSSNETYFEVYMAPDEKITARLKYGPADEAFPAGTVTTVNTWEYWAVSVKMNDNAQDSNVRIIRGVDNSEVEATTSQSGGYFIDRGGKLTLGCAHDSNRNLTTPFHGFIYNFHIDRGYYTLGDTELHYGNTGCDASCIDGVCTTVATQCLETAYNYDCDYHNGGGPDCFLCADPMCMQCSGMDFGDCNVCHEFTTESTGDCSCDIPRSNTMSRCFGCPGECDTCDTA